MEPRLKSTRLIDGEVKGIMDNRFCHFKQKAIVLILGVMATEFEEK